MRSAGICLGASSVDVVELETMSAGIRILRVRNRGHEGNVRGALVELVRDRDYTGSLPAAVTGKRFRSQIKLPGIAEPEATESAYGVLKHIYGHVDAIVSAGGETFMAYQLDSEGRIADVHTGSKCAAGTGEFYLQQVRRMDLNADTALQLAQGSDPYPLAGRCSVFCKSDCTHALNKGEDKGRVVAGLCNMMGRKVLELLSGFNPKRVMLVGGTSRNGIMRAYLRERLGDLVVPAEALYFEALGAALWAARRAGDGHARPRVLYRPAAEDVAKPELGGAALDRGTPRSWNTEPAAREAELFRPQESSFRFFDPLPSFQDRVRFHKLERGTARDGDRCIVGIDVGSTTTKALLLREPENSVLASVYLRTAGDPVGAARRCYRELASHVEGISLDIYGLGVTGSGRQIVGLNALTDSVINEIIAHAKAAVYFDAAVDTIFEIGGQDAKYTYITNGVPADYAMNEACSAGTGSFLEEAAREELGLQTTEVAPAALRGQRPPNFNDQCTAFISSDIKTAIHEGVHEVDIAAGLVYSVCMNYLNRVRGNRPVGSRVFMQGGVCYNRAVPIAMAALTDRPIAVAPEPGLMGAFGVALAVKEQIDQGLLEPCSYRLDELAQREVKQHRSFICRGAGGQCDRRCSIAVLEINGRRYPFGGVCSRYDRRYRNRGGKREELDLVAQRQRLLFERYWAAPGEKDRYRGRVGINRSLYTYTLLPLYSRFFAALGFETVLPEQVSEEGSERQAADFCYPVELSHGYTPELLAAETDYIFLPQVRGLYTGTGLENSITCPLAQGEPYYLRATWPQLRADHVLTPVLDFRTGFRGAEQRFIEVGNKLGVRRATARRAYREAVAFQCEFERQMRELGRNTLRRLERSPERRAIVLFGRPYSAMAAEANMGVPAKLASRGETVIPMEMLPLDQEQPPAKMYWSVGQRIMQAAELVSKNPQLFGVYVTNFSCGPDSFLVGYVRRTMGSKPSLTLELDGHTADGGLDTRIEAFLDVVDSYRQLRTRPPAKPSAAAPDSAENGRTRDEGTGVGTDHGGDRAERDSRSNRGDGFRPAEVRLENEGLRAIDSKGRPHRLDDERVRVLLPSMNDAATNSVAAALRYCGIRAEPCPPPGERELKLGRGNSSCKECLPMQLTLGSLLDYLDQREERGGSRDELLLYFMPESSGPCRLGQYSVFMEQLIRDRRLPDVALLSLSSEADYGGLGPRFTTRAWQGLVIGELFEDIRSAILALAREAEAALQLFEQTRNRVFHAQAELSWPQLQQVLAEEAEKLRAIPLHTSLPEAPKVFLTGEIYVRNDSFSRRFLVERLAERGIVTHVAPISEWLYYSAERLRRGLTVPAPGVVAKVISTVKTTVQRSFEKRVKQILSRSGLVEPHLIDVREMIAAAEGVVSYELSGETILTIGASFAEILNRANGVIAIGPFGCMPHRLSESIITQTLTAEKRKQVADNTLEAAMIERFPALPFLAIQSDGNSFPQVIEARLEAFIMRVERLHGFVLSRPPRITCPAQRREGVW